MKKIITLICLIGLSLTTNSSLVTAAPRKVKEPVKTKSAPRSKAAPKGTASKKQPAKKTTSTSGANAKKTRLELKEWTKKKHNLAPLELRDLIEENHKLRMQGQKFDIRVKEIEAKLRETLKQELAHEKANAAIRDLSELPAGSYTVDKITGQVFIGGILDERYGVDPETGIPFIKGIIFKVQIGANKDLDLKDVLIDEVHHENLEQEKEHNLYKYTIGHFRNYWEANKLKKGLRAMGIKLAWIVPYKDGKRVLLKEVLHTVIEQKNQRKTERAKLHDKTTSEVSYKVK